jgi:hypothetical protein
VRDGQQPEPKGVRVNLFQRRVRRGTDAGGDLGFYLEQIEHGCEKNAVGFVQGLRRGSAEAEGK